MSHEEEKHDTCILSKSAMMSMNHIMGLPIPQEYAVASASRARQWFAPEAISLTSLRPGECIRKVNTIMPSVIRGSVKLA
jgi:hypothetical protein